MADKGLLIPGLDIETIDAFKANAKKYRKQTMAALVRAWILDFNEQCGKQEAFAPDMPIVKQPVKIAPSPREVQPVKVAPVVETPAEALPDDCGEPTKCPVCGLTEGPLGYPALVTVRSKEDWGSWACHECNSSGRWFDNDSPIILFNSQEDSEGE